uniref:C-type lectin domain family 4, member a2 n=1 Tax=Mus spicilegus TaxID=10103 RepID=A0A8C6HAM6_MUSSI
MASEITYAEVKFKNESNSLHTYSESPAAPREKPIRDLSKPGSPSLLLTSLMVLLLLLAITFLVAFIIYFQKYSQLLEEKKAAKDITHNELNCTKSVSPMEAPIGQRALTLESIEVDLGILAPEDKVWSCCPKDWKLFGSHCYLVPTVSSSASWNKSEENCSRMGAHLVVIQSQEEQDFITGILATHAAYFIGLWDTGHRQWQWIDQTPYEESITFWHNGEPSSDNEKCATIIYRRNTGWGWNDISCSLKQKSVCQMKKINL